MGSSHQETRAARLKTLEARYKKLNNKSRRLFKIRTIIAYVAVFGVMMGLIALGSNDSTNSSTQASILDNIADSSKKPSADQLVEAGIVADLAEVANLPVAANTANISTSLVAKHETSQTSDTHIQKPQIITVGSLSRGIIAYTVQQGDTVGSLASKYGISEQTLRWANKLKQDASLTTDQEILIPSVNGVVYTVKSGDTVKSIVEKYGGASDRIIATNDLEVDGLKEGQRILIPDGNLPETERPDYVAPAPVTSSTITSNPYGGGGWTSSFAGNRYAYGYCTWYAYNRRAEMGRPIGSNWGNAATWAYYARLAGYAVNNTPSVGAVFQYGGGLGHVGIVESVDFESGTMTYSDMNGLNGWGRAGVSSPVPIKYNWNYIH